jgi:hypothetical protein
MILAPHCVIRLGRSIGDERNQRQLTRDLDLIRELRLVLAACACLTRFPDGSIIVEIPLQKRHILVVENVFLRRHAEAADFLLFTAAAPTASAAISTLSCHGVTSRSSSHRRLCSLILLHRAPCVKPAAAIKRPAPDRRSGAGTNLPWMRGLCVDYCDGSPRMGESSGTGTPSG